MRTLYNITITILLFFSHFQSITASIKTGPYLQTPTSNSIYICWQTDGGAESKIQYGLTNSLGSEKTGSNYSFSSNEIWHWVKITNLTPNTTYFYKCITESSESKVYTFKTQPSNGSASHVRFFVYGDNQGNYTKMFDTINVRMKRKAIELFGLPFENNMNFVMSLGDIVDYGGKSKYGNFKSQWFDPIKPISANIPFMVTMGSHESYYPGMPGYSNLDYSNLFNYMKYEDFMGNEGPYYYSFQIARVLFLSISCSTGIKLSDQANWLKSVLDKAETDNSIDWVLLFYHESVTELFPETSSSFPDFLKTNIENHGKIAAMFSGHTHAYERGQMPDLPVYRVTTGGSGGILDRWGDYDNQDDIEWVQKSLDQYNYLLVDVDCSKKTFNVKMFSQGNPESPKNNVLLDEFYLKRSTVAPPSKPNAIWTSDYISGSTYSGSEPIQSSQFQVSKNGTTILDSFRNYENIYNNKDLNLNIDLTKLKYNNKEEFKFRVRYRDRNLSWSDWSDWKNSNSSNTGMAVLTEKKANFEIYPNPAKNFISICPLNEGNLKDYQIIDLKGKIIKDVQLSKALQINISDLPAGTFFIREKKQPSQIKKFIKTP